MVHRHQAHPGGVLPLSLPLEADLSRSPPKPDIRERTMKILALGENPGLLRQVFTHEDGLNLVAELRPRELVGDEFASGMHHLLFFARLKEELATAGVGERHLMRFEENVVSAARDAMPIYAYSLYSTIFAR